jgi:hypothetical protein
VAIFEILSRRLPGGTEENHENLLSGLPVLDRDLNAGPPEYKVGVLAMFGNTHM